MRWLKYLAALATAVTALNTLVTPESASAKQQVRQSSAVTNNIYVHQSVNSPKTQIFLLQDYTGSINASSIIDKATQQPITLMNPPNCYGAVNTAIWYFKLGPKQTAQITNYAQTPVHLAIWVPVDSSLQGQDPTTCWFSNSCFSYPFTYGSPSTATPAGATFVELNVKNSVYDTVDISEVNGVNAQWKMKLPNAWTNSAYRSSGGALIPVGQIENSPGPGPNFYGNYGNPGVYPYGCTNCASRYNNVTVPATPPGTQKSGCLQADNNAPIPYPTMDVGCDNAINYYPTNQNPPAGTPNPALTAYQNPPPGVPSLPASKYYDPQYHKKLYDIAANPPIPFVGYGICEVQRGSSPAGGDIDITLEAYPFGQVQSGSQ
ncbi:MAG: hypothetical protein EKK48_04435 [Candidatus Melainabacteria bacterium]|nr:MAG: hypothetical protein EKK48_04435 [Candidatus Melainabacteria bacterium]